jgi:hypothetical protein
MLIGVFLGRGFTRNVHADREFRVLLHKEKDSEPVPHGVGFPRYVEKHLLDLVDIFLRDLFIKGYYGVISDDLTTSRLRRGHHPVSGVYLRCLSATGKRGDAEQGDNCWQKEIPTPDLPFLSHEA